MFSKTFNEDLISHISTNEEIFSDKIKIFGMLKEINFNFLAGESETKITNEEDIIPAKYFT